MCQRQLRSQRFLVDNAGFPSDRLDGLGHRRMGPSMETLSGAQYVAKSCACQAITTKYRVLARGVPRTHDLNLLHFGMARRERQAEYREGSPAADRFERTVNRLLNISKDELTRREATYKNSRAHKDRPGPRPKTNAK